eukprot:SAG11_NODE_1578_length_4652_cov_9.614759_1_plen_155_part_00
MDYSRWDNLEVDSDSDDSAPMPASSCGIVDKYQVYASSQGIGNELSEETLDRFNGDHQQALLYLQDFFESASTMSYSTKTAAESRGDSRIRCNVQNGSSRISASVAQVEGDSQSHDAAVTAWQLEENKLAAKHERIQLSMKHRGNAAALAVRTV